MPDRLSELLDRDITGAGTVEAQAGAHRARAQVRDADRIGVVVERLRVEGPPGEVSERARALTRDLHPAGERLLPVEVAPELGGAVLRSRPLPQRDGRFTQVDIGPDWVDVTRHTVTPDGVRQPADMVLTREQLGDMVDQIEQALDEPAQTSGPKS